MATEADNPLGDFLRARRELANPVNLGLSATGRRRVPGLRREELALLAGVSPQYYARLEQGRNRHPSPQVLEALARVLGLDEDSVRLLGHLANAGPLFHAARSAPPERVSPDLLSLVHRWTNEAVVIVGRYRDVLAANELAVALNPGFTPGRNIVRDVFTEPSATEIYLEWHDVAEEAVAALRASAGMTLDEPRMIELVGELSRGSDLFRQMWARHDVREKPAHVKRLNNPLVGPITVKVEPFKVAKAEGQLMFVFFAEPGSEDAQSLRLLGSLVDRAGHADGATPEGHVAGGS